ncbi:MAG: ribokinase [Planctomycetota bacterium]
MAKRIVVVGSSNTDMILQTERIPRPGETILGGEFVTAAGGKGANQAVAAAKAGGDVAFVAKVGDDSFGQQAIAGFVEHGINVQHVSRDTTAASGVALIFVADDGENSIGVASGANAQLTPEDVEAAEETLGRAGVVVAQLETPLPSVTRAAELAASSGAAMILNPAPAQPLPDLLLQQVTVLTPNETEAELLTGQPVNDAASAAEAARKLRSKGVAIVIVTLGANGCVVADEEGTRHVQAFRVSPVDSTAAGDVFNGALAVALAEEQPIATAVRFASAAAALSTTVLGAQPSAPDRSSIEEHLANTEAGADHAID